MIRFCDKEVFCISFNEMNRSELLCYFLNGHLDEPVCVFDSRGLYLGYITYYMLLKNSDTENAILREKIILDQNIWKNARLFFAVHGKDSGEYTLLPIIDDKRQLICFAYEDDDANRELRMLRELQEHTSALQFADIYPHIQSVKISGFHELAYFFAKYLRKQGISVLTEGELWETFFRSDKEEVLDYKTMTIYAEGTWGKTADWMDQLLRSVSVEFECIDHIYEENIRKGKVKDADWSSEKLINYLKDVNEVIILGTDITSQNAYDYFKKKNIGVCCFAEKESFKLRGGGCQLFGKPILGIVDAMELYSQAVFVDPHEKGSAWGMGHTDYFDYLGYRRNQEFFLLRDYMEIKGECLKSALQGQKIILAGDIYLCEKMADYFDENDFLEQQQLEYIKPPDEDLNSEITSLKIISIEEADPHALYLVAAPIFLPAVKSVETEIRSYLIAHGIRNITDYFSNMEAFIDMEKDTASKFQKEFLKPERIVVGSIAICSGNIFFRGLLDGHPSVMMMDYCFLNHNLFWYCIRLSGRKGSEILPLFLRLYHFESGGEKLVNPDLFAEKMNQLLEEDRRMTSQELFVIFHLAYMYMYGKDEKDLNHIMIYWEPHFLERYKTEYCAEWLGGEMKEVQCDVIEVVRNSYMRNGSNIKGILEMDWPGRGNICQTAISFDEIERRTYKNIRKRIVRFEDLKCRPEEELHRLCMEWEIPWSQSLMKVSRHGEEWVYDAGSRKVKDFDLTPVYHTYEEYFSELDRLKIAISCAPWQKKYGYPYVDSLQFSKRELQEIFLKEFRFIDRLHFDTERIKKLFDISFQNYVRKRLQKVRMFYKLSQENK